MAQNSANSTDWLDGAAVFLSALCMLHCIAVPLAIIGLPILSQFSESHLHLQLLVIVLPLSVFALAFGYRHHRVGGVVYGGALGLVLLVIGATLAHTYLGVIADRVFSVSGSIVLAASHYFNTVYSRRFRLAAVSG